MISKSLFTLWQYILSFLSLAVAISAVAQIDDSNLERSRTLSSEEDRIEGIIAVIESEKGPYDPSLLEPLESLSELQISAGDFAAVEAIQSRQLQLMRTEFGLDHPDNILMVRSIIENQIRLGKWTEVSDSLEHIRYLESVNRGSNPEGLVQAIEEQAEWFLYRVFLDEPRHRARNLLKSRNHYDDAEDLLVEQFGEESLELLPLFYNQALALYRLVAALNSSSSLSGDLMDRAVREDGIGKLQPVNSRFRSGIDSLFGAQNGIPIVDEDSIIGEPYLRDALSKINDIREILELNNETEALAMANMYYGDFQLLLDRGIGARSYRKARELLLEAGLQEEAIENYFIHPQVIPLPRFYSTLENAIVHRTTRQIVSEDKETLDYHLGEFVALEEDAATVRMPDGPRASQLPPPEHSVELSFRISSRGGVSAVKVLQVDSEDSAARRKAIRAVRAFKFRPSIVEGKNERVKTAHLVYKFSDTRSR